MKKHFLIPFFLILVTKCFAQQGLIPPLDKEQISKLIEKNDYCIAFVQDSRKIYLNPDALKIGRKTIYLEDEVGILYQISTLLTDESGLYTSLNNSQSDSTVYPIIQCKNCGNPFSPNIFNRGVCPNCNAQN